MTTEKQIVANQQNAFLSTGPKTEDGKAAVTLNPIKHGIFSKSLAVETKYGEETSNEYAELLNNLAICLKPQNQIESLLVEKIAVDFLRLNRVLRFEIGSIQKYIEETIKAFYDSYKNKPNEEIVEEIQRMQTSIDWNNRYLKYLKEGAVTFDQPSWSSDDLESDIIDDFYFIADSIKYEKLPDKERERLSNGEYAFSELKALLQKNGFLSDNDFSRALLELYENQNQKYKNEVEKLEQQKLMNKEAETLFSKICSIPQNEDVDKILKYERSLQKSIFQNLLMLKKLQDSF